VLCNCWWLICTERAWLIPSQLSTLSEKTFALSTVRLDVWPLCLHADHSCSCLIADLTQLPRFVCTPSPLVSTFLIPLWLSTYHFIHRDIFDTCFRRLLFVEQRIKGNFYPFLSNYLGTWTNLFFFLNLIMFSMGTKLPYRGKLKTPTRFSFQILDHKIVKAK